MSEFVTDFYSQSDVTWEIALKASYVFNDAFRHNILREEFWDPKYDLTKFPLLPGYHQMMKVPKFKLVTKHFARLIYFNAHTNPRYGVSLAKSTTTGEYIAMATMYLPNYAPPYKPVEYTCLGGWLKKWYLKILFKIQDILAFKSFENPLHPQTLTDEFEYGDRWCKAIATPERMAELKSMDRKQLSEVAYPKPWSYYLNFFAVRNEYQGKGVATLFLKDILRHLTEEVGVVEPPEFPGPAKIELFSSPRGVRFYEKFGFTLAAFVDTIMPSGQNMAHVFYYLNLT